MKKSTYIIPLLLVISMAFGVQAFAKSMDDVVGTYSSMKLKDKYWIQGEATLKDTGSGKGKIKANKKWSLNRKSPQGILKYSGKCSVKGNEFIVKKTKALRDQIEKKTLKRWLKLYVEDQGETITNINFTYSKYKITKAKIKSQGPVSLKIILHGTLSGKVSGEGKVKRKFKYESKITFGRRTVP